MQLESNQDLVEAERRATAHHEAGHAVIVWRLHLGMPEFVSIRIDEKDDTSGRIVYDCRVEFDGDDDDQTHRCAEKMALAALAGPAAQLRYAPGSYDHDWQGVHWGRGDYDIASDIVFRLNGSSKAAALHLKYLEKHAGLLVEQYWADIEKVAAALLEKETLDQDQLGALLLGEIRSKLKAAINAVESAPMEAFELRLET